LPHALTIYFFCMWSPWYYWREIQIMNVQCPIFLLITFRMYFVTSRYLDHFHAIHLCWPKNHPT
jgi:hypothetical protein